MPTPRAKYWKAIGPDGQAEPGRWRNAETDPPPAPPTEVFWLEHPIGIPDGMYEHQAAMGALPSFKSPQNP